MTFTSPFSITRDLPTQFLGGALALLLICGTALLGGMPGYTANGKTARSLWDTDTEIPLLNTMAHPKDLKRSPDQRWRHAGDGEDLPDIDQPWVIAPRSESPTAAAGRSGYPAPHDSAHLLSALHRPQAARAPPSAT